MYAGITAKIDNATQELTQKINAVEMTVTELREKIVKVEKSTDDLREIVDKYRPPMSNKTMNLLL